MRHGPSLLGASSLTTLTIQYGLAVFVELQLRNHDLGWGDANGNRLAVNLFAGDTLDVDNVFETVNGCDLSLTALQGAPSNDDFVVLTDGDGADLYAASRNDSLGTVKLHNYCCRMKGLCTPCFSRNSLDSGADMIVLRTEDGAWKWAFRDFLREAGIPIDAYPFSIPALESCSTDRNRDSIHPSCSLLSLVPSSFL